MSAPLRLLVPSAASETVEMLLRAASSGGVMTISSGQPEHDCVILYSGMQLKLSVTGGYDISGFKQIFCNVDESSIGSVISIGLGDHLGGGEKVPAIVQAFLVAAAAIGEMTEAFAVMWIPAKTISGFEYFARVVAEYGDGGVFPVLALVNFKKEDDGAIRSTGLDWLSGQELCVAPTGLSEAEMMRRVVRVAHDLAVNGPVTSEIDLDGMDENETVELRPSGDVLGVRILSAAAR